MFANYQIEGKEEKRKNSNLLQVSSIYTMGKQHDWCRCKTTMFHTFHRTWNLVYDCTPLDAGKEPAKPRKRPRGNFLQIER